MDLDDAWVEIGARAAHEYDLAGQPGKWSDLVPAARTDYRSAARAALSAVAPLIAARGWDEAWSLAESCVKHPREARQPNPYRIDTEGTGA